MKITICSDEKIEETQVSISCKKLTPEIERVVSMLRLLDLQLMGMCEGEICFLDPQKVLYIDTADKKTFLYTEEKVYETNLKLYELEERLAGAGFFRGGKSCIINLRHIQSLRADFDRRIQVTLDNGEKLVVSRQYADAFKKKLGVK